jgi:hypothetical protein
MWSSKTIWERIIVRNAVASHRVVNYTIRPGACPVGTWYAIAKLDLPHHGHPVKTKRTEWCRAKLDFDGTVLGIWDWVDRRWIETKLAISINKVQNANKETVNGTA